MKAVPSPAGLSGFPGRAAGRCHSGRTLLPRLAVPSSSHKTGTVPFQNSPAAMNTSGELYTSPVPAAECPLRGAGHLPSPRGTFLPWPFPSGEGRLHPRASPTSLCSCKGALPSRLTPETPRVSPAASGCPVHSHAPSAATQYPSQLPGYLARRAELCAGARHSRAAWVPCTRSPLPNPAGATCATPTSFHGRARPLTARRGWQQEGHGWALQDGGTEGSLLWQGPVLTGREGWMGLPPSAGQGMPDP